MALLANNYLQLKDYFNQLISVSECHEVQTINQTVIAKQLNVDNSGVSRFLSGHTKQPKKTLENFQKKYACEFQSWPANQTTIGRIIKVRDCHHFLNPTKYKHEKTTVAIKPKQPQTQTNEVTKKSIHRGISLKKPEVVVPKKIVPPSVTKDKKRIKPHPLISQLAKKSMLETAVVISYRGHEISRDKNSGKIRSYDAEGMVFDHQCFQTHVNRQTLVLLPSDDVAATVKKLFFKELKKREWKLLFGKEEDQVIRPHYITSCADLGLLVIPGRARANEDEEIRWEHERQQIRNALNRGQPILAICAGAWRVYEECVIQTRYQAKANHSLDKISALHKNNETLVEVKDHNFNGGMLCLNSKGQVIRNKPIHNIVVTSNTLLKSLWKNKRPVSVNSVHSKAINPDAQLKPLNIKINAFSAKMPGFNCNTRQGKRMQPQVDSVEGFENKWGAPLMGIQWHLEGYEEDTEHAALIKYMALAGDAYAAKRKMIAQLSEEITQIEPVKCLPLVRKRRPLK